MVFCMSEAGVGGLGHLYGSEGVRKKAAVASQETEGVVRSHLGRTPTVRLVGVAGRRRPGTSGRSGLEEGEGGPPG